MKERAEGVRCGLGGGGEHAPQGEHHCEFDRRPAVMGATRCSWTYVGARHLALLKADRAPS